MNTSYRKFIAGSLVASAAFTQAHAGLFSPALQNPSMETDLITDDQLQSRITDWFDSKSYTYTAPDRATTHPDTPYGDNWAELGSERWIYQQIGTYEEGMNLDVSFLMGRRTDKDSSAVNINLLVGGNPALADDVNTKYNTDNPLVSTVGATIIDTAQVSEVSTSGTTEEKKVSLSSGTGHTVGDPLWIQIHIESKTSRVLIDNVAVAIGDGGEEPPEKERPAPSDGPNILFILVDDWGWTDHSNQSVAEGNKSDLYQTPNFNKFVASGVACSSAYAYPNCAPTRAALISGQYSPRRGNGVYNVDSLSRAGGSRTTYTKPANQGSEHVNGDEQTITIAEAFVNSGYVTSHFGKYHAGATNPTDPTFPLNQGYDFNYGGQNKGNPGNYFASNNEFHSNVGPELDPFAGDYDMDYINKNLMPYANGNDPTILDGTAKHITDAMADAFISFMDNHKAGAMSDYPVYAQLHYYAVHSPIQPRPDLQAKFENFPDGVNHDSQKYAALIEGMDQSLGRVIDYLSDPDGDGDHSDSIAENTLVIFCSDNGGYRNYTSNAPLRGHKGNHYNGGLRVPCAISMPGTIPAGKVSDTLTHVVDFYPTMLDFANGVYPDSETHPLDGQSLKNHLLNPDTVTRDRKPIFYHFPGYMDDRAYNCSAVIKEINGKRYKYIYAYDPYYAPGGNGVTVGFDQYQLYNLTDDIGETVNLMDYIDIENPNDPDDPSSPNEYENYVAYKGIANELAAELNAWLVGEEGDTTWQPIYSTYKDIFPGIDPSMIGKETGPAPAAIPNLPAPARYGTVFYRFMGPNGLQLDWSIEEEDGITSYAVEIKTEAGWETIYQTTTLINGVGSFVDETGTMQDEYRLVLTDDTGLTQNVTISSQKTTVNYTVQKGWNLLSMPLSNADITNLKPFAPLWGWTGNQYEIVTQLPAYNGFWIYSNEEQSIEITGNEAAEGSWSDGMITGWNLTGPHDTVKVPDWADAIYSWNSYYNNLLDQSIMLRGIGYWIYVFEEQEEQ